MQLGSEILSWWTSMIHQNFTLPSRSFFKLPCTSVLHVTAFRSSTVAQASKPAWSQESFITKSYKIIQFWQTLKIYWLIFVHFLVIFRISWPSTVSHPAFPGVARALPAAADSGAAGALRHADGWPPFGATTSSLPGVLVGKQNHLKKLIQWEFLKYSIWEVRRWIQTKDHVELM